MKDSLFICSSLGDQKMNMGMEIDFLPEGLNDANDSCCQISSGYQSCHDVCGYYGYIPHAGCSWPQRETSDEPSG